MRPEWNAGVCPHGHFIRHADGTLECLDCGDIDEQPDDSSPLDEPADIEEELMEYWRERSDLF